MCIKIRTKIKRENITDSYKTIRTVLQKDSSSRFKIFERFERFKDGVTRLPKIAYVDHPRSNWPSTSGNNDTVLYVREQLRSDRIPSFSTGNIHWVFVVRFKLNIYEQCCYECGVAVKFALRIQQKNAKKIALHFVKIKINNNNNRDVDCWNFVSNVL